MNAISELTVVDIEALLYKRLDEVGEEGLIVDPDDPERSACVALGISDPNPALELMAFTVMNRVARRLPIIQAGGPGLYVQGSRGKRYETGQIWTYRWITTS